MLYRTWLVFFLLGCLAPVWGDKFTPFAGPQPLAILIEEDPWAEVIGAQTPRIAVYENGDVIFSREVPRQKSTSYFYAKLEPEALSSLLDRVERVSKLSEVKPNYSLTAATDQGRARFYLHLNGREVVTSVYGLRSGTARNHDTMPNLGSLPEPLWDLYSYLSEVQFTESRPWHPAYVEAMIWPYDYAPEESLPWPKGWPDLRSPRAMARGDGYSIFLDAGQEPALVAFLARRKEKGAVEIDGKKWTMAYRPTFPSEPVWRKAFEETEK